MQRALALHGATLKAQLQRSSCLRNAPRLRPQGARPASTAARRVPPGIKPKAAGAQAAAAGAAAPGAGHGLFNPLAQQLAQRPSPVLLYQGESRAPYVTGCFVIGGLLTIYAVTNGSNLIDPRVDLNSWVLGGFAVVCVGMQCIGFFMFSKALRIVSSVSAIPTVLPSGQRALMMRLHTGLVRNKHVDIPCDSISMSGRLYIPPARQTAADKLVAAQRAKQRQQWERDRIMTLPFRQASYWTWRGFRNFQRVFTDEGWINIRIKGRRGVWKLHERPAWALRDGKVLDDLVRHY